MYLSQDIMLKVIQINVWGFRRFNELIKFLKAENPDIINMQEAVTGKANPDQKEVIDYLNILKTELNMEYVFGPTCNFNMGDGKLNELGWPYSQNIQL